MKSWKLSSLVRPSHLLFVGFAALLTVGVFSKLSAVGSDNAAEPSVPLQLLGYLDRTNYPADTKIILSVILTNRTGQIHRDTISRHPIAEFSYRLTAEGGKEVSLTEFGRKLFKESTWLNAKSFAIGPFQAHTTTVVLTDVFNLRSPQKYELTISRAVQASHVIYSAPIRFSVGKE